MVESYNAAFRFMKRGWDLFIVGTDRAGIFGLMGFFFMLAANGKLLLHFHGAKSHRRNGKRAGEQHKQSKRNMTDFCLH